MKLQHHRETVSYDSAHIALKDLRTIWQYAVDTTRRNFVFVHNNFFLIIIISKNTEIGI